MFDSIAMRFHPGAWERIEKYCAARGLSIDKQLGFGQDGVVLATKSGTALKALKNDTLYERERNVYHRLRERNVQRLAGFAVPTLVDHDDQLLILEMEIVSPPFVVDFAAAGLDRPLSQFTAEILAQIAAEREENFGEDWPRVQQLLSEFRKIGVHLSDIRPANVRFR